MPKQLIFIIILLVAIDVIVLGIFYFSFQCEEKSEGIIEEIEEEETKEDNSQTLTQGELLKDIEEGKSIMGFWPHPDDEVYTPGILTMAGDKGNKIWIVSLVSIEYVPEKAKEARYQAIDWLEDKYLEEYIDLNMARGPKFKNNWHSWQWDLETIKSKYKKIIEEKRPGILLTFTPYGSCDLIEHGIISDIVTEIWSELNYEPKPKIYWFINTNQGPRNEVCLENELYPPTDVLDLNVYSETLGKTYWEAKIELWQKYAPSVPPLNNFLTPDSFEKDDKKEYFFKVDEKTMEKRLQEDMDVLPKN